MKKLFAPILIVALFLTGCNTTGTLSSQIAKDAPLVQVASQLATQAALLNVSPANRVSDAQEVYTVAAAINAAAATQTDLSGVNAIAQQYIAQWNSPDKVMVGALVTTLTGMVQTYVNNNYSSYSPIDQITAMRALLTAASAGAEAGSLPYCQAVPSLSKGLKAVAPGKIVVTPFVWTKPK